MSKTKHTPGPWEAISNLVRTRCTPDGNGGFLIAECPPSIGDRLENARLIAAAPDLLEAHEPEREGPDFLDWMADRLVNVYGESENVDFVVCLRRRANKARAAIIKATGGAE